jgi:hypothetical protein
MMSKREISDPIYAVHAEAVPVMIYAHQLGPQEFRIRFARGIGWSPTIYRTRKEVLAAVSALQSYTRAEARMAKEICKPEP